jgi:hypothetical protein
MPLLEFHPIDSRRFFMLPQAPEEAGCCGQVISDTTIGSRTAIFRS